MPRNDFSFVNFQNYTANYLSTFCIIFLQALFCQPYREHFQLTVWGQNAICTSESLCSNFVLIQIAKAKCKLQTAKSKIKILNPSFTVPCHFQSENEENKFLANKNFFTLKILEKGTFCSCFFSFGTENLNRPCIIRWHFEVISQFAL